MQEIYDRQHKRIYRIAFLYLKNPQDTEDAVSAVFLKYIEKPRTFDSLDHETAWFIQVTKNYCKNEKRLFWKRSVDLGDIPDDISRADTDSDLLEAVFQLPVKYSELLYLYYYEGYSIREIAKILNCKESTLQSRMSTARQKLKKLIEKEV